jgi:hypothetical protein
VQEKGGINSDYLILTAFHGKRALRIIKWEDMQVSLAWKDQVATASKKQCKISEASHPLKVYTGISYNFAHEMSYMYHHTVYLDMLNHYTLPQLEVHTNIVFQEDGTLHILVICSNQWMPNSWISD